MNREVVVYRRSYLTPPNFISAQPSAYRISAAAVVIPAAVSAAAAAHNKDYNENYPAAVRSTKAIVHNETLLKYNVL